MSRRTRAALLCVVGGVALAGCTIGPETVPSATPAPSTSRGPVPPEPVTPSSPPQTFVTLDDYASQSLDWSDCGDGFECATLTAPLDYSDPGGDTISVAVNRLPSTGTADRIGSLLVNPGGPGGSGLDYARGDGVVSDAILGAYDLVGFDPRGVGESTPVECLADGDYDAYIQTDSSPDDAVEATALDEAAQSFADGCERSSGELLPHVGTADVARDVDLLRTVLGDDELYFLGKSYGTFIGAIYADLFPEHVGRLVLDGAVDPSQPSLERSVDQAAGFDGALRAYAADCLQQDECPLSGSVDDAVGEVSGLFDELDQSPLPSDDGRELGQTLATYGVSVTLYNRVDGWPLLTQGLQQAFDGNGTILQLLSDFYFDRQPDGSYKSNSNEIYLAVNCLDRGPPENLEAMESELAEYKEHAPVFGVFLAFEFLPCAHWPVPADLAPHAVTAPGAAPILVVGTTRDPATPYDAAVSLADQLESGVLLTYDGDGHTAYEQGSECVDDAVDAYLLTGTAPAEGTTC